ncbi:hypothetical protein B0H63DRAFT_476982 [Podospora didyma]|uniref:BTB domain-containing protein n=1 Tax=Podospora didyma TaxID=330526 RepID=A0AAE0NI61_9PEZI|nr:hypothetical protein B0H63DRAFT_476982 [Podospora didyma]
MSSADSAVPLGDVTNQETGQHNAQIADDIKSSDANIATSVAPAIEHKSADATIETPITTKVEKESAIQEDVETSAESTESEGIKLDDANIETANTEQPVAEDATDINVAENTVTHTADDEKSSGPPVEPTNAGECLAPIAEESSPVPVQDVKPKEGVIKAMSYHRDSDLYIKVKEPNELKFYKVWSATIAAASPVWRKMIYGGEYPRPETGLWIIHFLDEDDYWFGLDIVFSIAHYKFHEIPARPDVDQLFEVAHVAEKYECTHLLVPYMEKWVDGLNWHCIMKPGRTDDDKTLYLTWVFGEVRWFSKVLSKVANKATIDDNGDLLDASGRPWKNQGLPNALLDLISSTRMRTIEKLIEIIEVPHHELMDVTKPASDFCRSKDATDDTKQACRYQQLGSLFGELTKAGLVPIPKAADYKGSATDLATKVANVKVICFKIPGSAPHLDSHWNCGIKNKEKAEAAISGNAPPSAQLIQQLKDRAEKSGAYSDVMFYDFKEIEERDPSPDPMDDLHSDDTHYKQGDDDVPSHHAGIQFIKKRTINA